MSVPDWVKEYLEKNRVRYEEHHHRATFTAQEVASQEHVSGHHVAKVVVAVADEKNVLLVLPATHHVDFERGRTALGVKTLRMASEQEIARDFPDCEVGAIPPLRHWKGVEIWMDPSMDHYGEFLFQAGTHEDAILMDFKGWLGIVTPKKAEFARTKLLSAS